MSIHGMYPKHGFYLRYAFQASKTITYEQETTYGLYQS